VKIAVKLNLLVSVKNSVEVNLPVSENELDTEKVIEMDIVSVRLKTWVAKKAPLQLKLRDPEKGFVGQRNIG
jgi:hypothetical protein